MRLLRWTLTIAAVVLGLLLIAGSALFAFGDRIDFASLAAGRLSASLDRRVTIGSLRVTPGRWLHVQLRDFQLANLPGGSQPIMTSVAGIEAEIDALSLLHGPVVARRLVIDNLQLLLERNETGLKNWKFAGEPQNPPPRPTDRGHFPTLLDTRLTGDITFRASSGDRFDTRIDASRLFVDPADRSVHIAATGAYNSVPLKFDADLAPLAVLRDTAKPYPVDLRAASGDARLAFKGTMTDPLGFNGAVGTLALVAPSIAPILRIAGATADLAASLRLEGPFTHDEPVWHLTQATGALDDSTILSADLNLHEGPHGQPDDVAADIAFDRLDLGALLAANAKSAGGDPSLAVERNPGTLLTLKLAARQLDNGALHVTDARLAGAIKPGLVTLDTLSFGYLGAGLRAHGRIEAVTGPNNAELGHATADAQLDGMDVQTLRKLAQAGPVPLTGRVDGQAQLDATGATLNLAARATRLSAILMMNGGSVSRQVIALAATDARTLFRRAEGMTPLACAVAVIDVRGGVGTISPLRLRSADGTITGRGTFDLARRTIDVTVASDSRTTGFFALDVPMHVSGPIADPSIRPAALSKEGRALLSEGDNVGRLLPALQPFARRSACLAR